MGETVDNKIKKERERTAAKCIVVAQLCQSLQFFYKITLSSDQFIQLIKQQSRASSIGRDEKSSRFEKLTGPKWVASIFVPASSPDFVLTIFKLNGMVYRSAPGSR